MCCVEASSMTHLYLFKSKFNVGEIKIVTRLLKLTKQANSHFSTPTEAIIYSFLSTDPGHPAKNQPKDKKPDGSKSSETSTAQRTVRT